VAVTVDHEAGGDEWRVSDRLVRVDTVADDGVVLVGAVSLRGG